MRLKKGGNIWGDMASGLIHTGIPAIGSVLVGLGGEVLGGPVGAAMGGVGGSEVGNMIANKIGDTTGYGIVQEKFFNPQSTMIGGIQVPFKTNSRVGKENNVKIGGSFLAI